MSEQVIDPAVLSSRGDDPAPEERSDAYRVRLPMFEGPLDLLLHLIQKHELSILDIPIGFVAEKYVEYIAMMEQMSIDLASEYLVMAATLVHLKSRSLLPADPHAAEEDAALEEEEDPRTELIRRLLEYQKYKHAAEALAERPLLGRDIFPRGAPADLSTDPAPLAPLSLFKLVDAFEAVLKRAKRVVEHEVDFERITITDKIGQISEQLKINGVMRFEQLFEADTAHAEMIVTFLALLEMTKLRMTRLRQDGPLATIFVELAVSDDEAGLMDPLEELSLAAIRTGGAELITEELRQASERRELELSAEELSELGLNDRGFSELEASELGFSPEELSERGLSELERLELGLSEQELAELELAELMGFVPRPEELAEEPSADALPVDALPAEELSAEALLADAPSAELFEEALMAESPADELLVAESPADEPVVAESPADEPVVAESPTDEPAVAESADELVVAESADELGAESTAGELLAEESLTRASNVAEPLVTESEGQSSADVLADESLTSEVSTEAEQSEEPTDPAVTEPESDAEVFPEPAVLNDDEAPGSRPDVLSKNGQEE
jgi:segregation and condensation protein A